MEKNDLPIIIESDTSNLSSHQAEPKHTSKSASSGKEPSSANLVLKGAFIILGLILIVEIINGIRVLTSPIPSNEVSAVTTQPLMGGKIILTTDKPEYNIGDIVTVTARLVTGGHSTLGTDLILKYNPQVLELNGAEAISPGKTYADYPLIGFDPNLGLISVSGLAPANVGGFNGIGDFATIQFKATKSGPADFQVEYQPGSTIDTNIIDENTAQDIIDEVQNVNVKIN